MKTPWGALTSRVKNAAVRLVRPNHGLALHAIAIAKLTTKPGTADIAGTAIPHYLMQFDSNQYATKRGPEKHRN
jgi:hypothetical protein